MLAASPLGSSDVVAFAATCDQGRAIAFYRDKLGLRLVSHDSFAAVFDAHGTMLRVTTVPKVAPAPYTVLGWSVADIVQTARELIKAGVKFERYEGIKQDELGIWTAPGGAGVVWFKDPDGNILSLTEF